MAARTPALSQGTALPRDGHPDALALIAAENPGHRIWRENTHDGPRYVARSLARSIHPHTLITASLDEMRAELTAARH